ncbi:MULTISPECIES: type II toxin-antitoxin system Phd/YefM family antitoxin [unclassified Kribbella]|uniref:type II toxin-antitoxin system Phd/YefM family antitoxin n=1 Tax=unclassified Kribbella TaxID=2644121 RepID=UPI0037A1E207|nr:type II toxin-antitoxin system prevent-host-death family antitoxin [Kribbella sp. NBC_00889]
MDIGIRELRDGLSHHLMEVREGRTITITDHGKPIARLVPVDGPARLQQLVAEGKVRPPLQRKRPPIPTKADGIVSDLIPDQRR